MTYMKMGEEKIPDTPFFSSSTTTFGAPQSGHFGHEGQLHGGQATVTGAALAGAGATAGADALGVEDMLFLYMLPYKKNQIPQWFQTGI